MSSIKTVLVPVLTVVVLALIFVLNKDSSYKEQNFKGVKKTAPRPYVHMDTYAGQTLPQNVVDGVKTFVFFIGYQRSGSSIMSSLMDAHPHVVISYQYGKIFSDINAVHIGDKGHLFNALYKKSWEDAESGPRSDSENAKNYSLHIPSLWQGRYDRYISVIGNKNAGQTVSLYVSSPSTFIRRYKKLQKVVGAQVKAVFVVRNPYDIISTSVLYDSYKELKKFANIKLTKEFNTRNEQSATIAEYKSKMTSLFNSGKMKEFEEARFQTNKLATYARTTAKKAEGIKGIIKLMGKENVWQVHNIDLINYPQETLEKMCKFFEIDCSLDYINACSRMVFKSSSKTRELLVWPQKERKLVMDSIIKTFPFFSRYDYNSD